MKLKAIFAQYLIIGLLITVSALPLKAFCQEQSTTDAINIVEATEITTSINLQNIAVLHYTSEGLLLSDVVQLTQWQRTFSLTPIPENKVLWVRFQIQNSGNINIPLMLIAGNTFIDRIDGFLVDDQGRIIQSIQRNNANPNSAASGLHGFRMALTSRPDQRLSVYLRINDDGPAILPVELWDEQSFEQQSSIRLILLGALSGGLSLLATYFLITYMLKNAPARFWFAIFSVASMTTLLSAEGILPSLFNLPAFAAEITAFSLTISLFAAIKIGRDIFVPVSRVWLRAHYFLLAVPIITLFLYNDFWQLISILGIISAFLVSKLFATLIYRSKIDMRSTIIYFCGWLAIGLVALLEVLSFAQGASHLSYSAALPFAFTCFGIMLVGVAIISREHSLVYRQEYEQATIISNLQHFADVFDNTAEGLYAAKSDGTLLRVNAAFTSLFGFESEQQLLTTLHKIHDLFSDPVEADLLLGELSSQRTVIGKEFRGKRVDGREFWFSISSQIVKAKGDAEHFGSLFDITERRVNQINLQYLNTHDQLTGLHNRRHFLQLLNDKITHSKVSSEKFAVFYIDVDQFKIINDTCGHAAGDVFIKELAHELYEVFDPKWIFARLSADEFGLIVEYNDESRINATIEKIFSQVRNFEFKWDRHRFSQSVSIGIARRELNAADAEELLSFADTACIVAKESGRDKVHEFSKDMNTKNSYERELYWVNEVTRALKEDSFELYFQHYRPLNKSDDNDYYEILIRLRTETGDLTIPEFFMPAAERCNLSNKIDKWVIENYFIWLNTNSEYMHKLAMCNINITGHSLSDDDFQFFLLNAFEKYHIPPEKICFEITETLAIIKMNDVVAFIKQFKRLGCTFAIDDFGSGFSSYAYLKNLPVDYVKIDGNFIRNILTDPIDLAMVTSIRDVAGAMSIQTVAEFVESDEIMVQLGKMGLDFAQGYCIAEPAPLINFLSYNNGTKE
ncbi:MAG: diguanylate cyclase (GGDEF)-like protein/PAS domain S-box-containing protein [Bermanella sp.]|jgi:diguanylate cyclase (GGDEF)-like protein/PAS domain S-box-containing protein